MTKILPHRKIVTFYYAVGLLVRAWALPLLVLGWVAGVVSQALAVGFAAAWDSPLFRRAAAIRSGHAAADRQLEQEQLIQPSFDTLDGDDDDA